MEPSRPTGEDRIRRLSERERQVLELAARGLTNAEIAEELELSVYTIKFHLGSAYRKLGVANRTEAAVMFTSGRRPFANGGVR